MFQPRNDGSENPASQKLGKVGKAEYHEDDYEGNDKVGEFRVCIMNMTVLQA